MPKPGNVHPGVAFIDTSYDDFVRSAGAIGPVFERAAELSVGQLVLEAAQATKHAVGKNTNLGIILVLAPLVKGGNEPGMRAELDSLTVRDAELVYEAIRIASPGGLGKAESQDVQQQPTVTLLEAMRLAADRDLIARQYVTGFKDVFGLLLPTLECSHHAPRDDALCESPNHAPLSPPGRGGGGEGITLAIQHTFLIGLATLGDTLIARKCGVAVMKEAQQRAQKVLEAGWPNSAKGQFAYQQLDAWLRADGHRRNPGTMADLIAGTIYLALRRGSLPAVFP